MSSPVASKTVYRFGAFELMPETLELRRSGALVKATPQALTVLTMLVRRTGELVTRDEIRKQLWGDDTFVDFDQGLNHCIKQVRAALSDDAQSPRFVETLPRRGYRFIAPVANGDGDTAVGHAAGAVAAPRKRTSAWVFAAVVVLVIAGLLYAIRQLPPERRRIAVLPFENLTGDGSQDYIADGLTEELSSQIARLDPRRLGVIARTSAFKYKHTDKGADEIGRELNAEYLVEGSVRNAGGRLRITAQLIRTSDQSHVWADSYDRPLDALLQVEAEVASSIARTIDVNMSAKAAAMDHLPDWRAYSAYLKGRHLLLDTKREHEVHLALDYFRQAIALDPAYALAHAGLADAHAELADFDTEPKSAYASARAAAAEALRIDPQLAEAHVSLGRILAFHDWDFRRAEDEFRAAIASKPAYEEGYHSYSHLLMALGRFDEAIAMGERVLELDPLSPHMNAHMGLTHFYAGRPAEAIARLQKTIQLDAGYIRGWLFLGRVYDVQGDHDKAVVTLRKAAALRADSSEGLPELAAALAAAGETGEARRILAQLGELRGRRYVSPLELAIVRLALAERQQALDELERAVAERNPDCVYLAHSPYFRRLRGDARFEALLKRIRG